MQVKKKDVDEENAQLQARMKKTTTSDHDKNLINPRRLYPILSFFSIRYICLSSL